MRVRAITFDVYGTLLRDAREPLVGVCRRIVRDLGLEMAAEEFLRRWEARFYALLEEGFMGMEEANLISLREVFRHLGLRADAAGYVRQVVEEWARRPPYPEVPTVLERLAAWPKALVTNADEGFLMRALRRRGLDFDVIVTSEGMRAYKPSDLLFRAALKRLGFPASQVLHVGDSLREDVGGARAVGMRTVWVQRSSLDSPEPKPDAVIGDLRGLLDLLPQGYEVGRP